MDKNKDKAINRPVMRTMRIVDLHVEQRADGLQCLLYVRLEVGYVAPGKEVVACPYGAIPQAG